MLPATKLHGSPQGRQQVLRTLPPGHCACGSATSHRVPSAQGGSKKRVSLHEPPAATHSAESAQ